ncbi:hypothetical protein QZH41_008631, partial [Actinostola sp. cb2023]
MEGYIDETGDTCRQDTPGTERTRYNRAHPFSNERTYETLNKPKITKAKEKIYPYGSNKSLPILGKLTAEVESRGKFAEEKFFIVKGNGGCLLSWNISQHLGLVQVVRPITQSQVSKQLEIESLVKEYDDLFNDLGKLKGFQVKLHIDEGVQPVAQPHRRVPFHVRKQLEEQLCKDEELGVIENVDDGPTPWISPIVVVPKRALESMDFAELPTGDYLLVLIDDYSRFPMVEIIKSTSSRTVIPCLDKIFSEYGIPEMLRSDNGPPFNGNAFREFANYLGFLHRKITPYWPRANGEAERFMRTIKKAVNAALIE